jgi:phage shock protein PspC (stress-responsive transcriptional regulator)
MTTNTETPPQSQPLRRPVEGRLLVGVAAGIARYLDVDVTLVRVVFAVLTLVGGAGVPLYLAGWLLMPEEGSDRPLASELLGRFGRPSSQ